MKRILGIVMVAVAVLAAPMAQAELRLGVKAGANISNFTTPDESALDFSNASLANFTGGLTVEWLFMGGLGIDASVMYTAKGTEYKVGDDILSDVYEGIMGTENNAAYKFEIPEVPGITKDRITDNLLEIAKTCIVDRNILYDSQQENKE